MSVCSLADVPKTRISPLPRTTRPRPQKLPPIRITPHRYLPRRQTAPKLLQQSITYTYSLYKDYSNFPLTSGDGTYQVGVYENVSDDRYTTLLSETFSVTLTDPLKPYLYPNQYVNFTARPKNLQTVLPAIWTSSAVYIIISLHIPHGRFCTSVPFSIIICLDLSLPFWYCLSSV